MLRRLGIAFCLLCLSQLSQQRSLQQSSLGASSSQSVRISAKYYSALDNGGLALISNYTLTYLSNGSVTVGTVNTAAPGFPLTLSSGDLILSDTFKRAGCFNVSLSPSSEGIGGFVSTYADVIGTTSSSGLFRISTATILDGTNVSTTDGGPHFGVADPSEEYVFVIYNLGRYQNTTRVQITAQTSAGCALTPAPSPSQLTPFVARSPTAGTNTTGLTPAPASGAAGPATNTSTVGILPVTNSSAAAPTGRRLQQISSLGAPARGPSLTQQSASEGINSPAPGPSATQTDTVQLTEQDLLSDSSLIWLGAFTNVSCVAYKLLRQQANILGNVPSRIDLSIFLLDENSTTSWASQQFSLSPNNIDFQAITLQNNANNNDQFRYLDGLDNSRRYFLWAVTGMQKVNVVSSNIIMDIAYTAASSGSCSNNIVSQYSGSTVQQYGSSSSTSPPPSSAVNNANAPSPASSVRGLPSNATSSIPSTSSGSTVAPASSNTRGAPSGSTSSNPVVSSQPPALTTPSPPAAAPQGGLQLQGGSTSGGTPLFPLPGKKLRLS